MAHRDKYHLIDKKVLIQCIKLVREAFEEERSKKGIRSLNFFDNLENNETTAGAIHAFLSAIIDGNKDIPLETLYGEKFVVGNREMQIINADEFSNALVQQAQRCYKKKATYGYIALVLTSSALILSTAFFPVGLAALTLTPFILYFAYQANSQQQKENACNMLSDVVLGNTSISDKKTNHSQLALGNKAEIDEEQLNALNLFPSGGTNKPFELSKTFQYIDENSFSIKFPKKS